MATGSWILREQRKRSRKKRGCTRGWTILDVKVEVYITKDITKTTKGIKGPAENPLVRKFWFILLFGVIDASWHTAVHNAWPGGSSSLS